MSSASVSQATSSMSAITNDNSAGVGIGNFKGIMLCNRPFGGASSSIKAGNDGNVPDETRNFICGNIPSEVGQFFSTVRKICRKKPSKYNVISKHRMWLADLQRKRDAMADQIEMEQTEKEDKLKKFMVHEAELRHELKRRKEEAEAKGESTKNLRPKWAQSKEQSIMEEMKKKEVEDEDLIDFANNLDFEQDMEKAEVDTMIHNIEKEVDDIESDTKDGFELIGECSTVDEACQRISTMTETDKKAYDYVIEVDDDDCPTSALILRREQRNKVSVKRKNGTMVEIDDLHKEDIHGAGNHESKMEADAAENILSLEDIGLVHSKKSMTQVVNRSMDKMKHCSTDDDLCPMKGEVIQHPRIVETNEDRLEHIGAAQVSNLPYIHRNPAL